MSAVDDTVQRYRLTVRTPLGSVDVTVPGDLVLAELPPAAVRLAADRAAAGAAPAPAGADPEPAGARLAGLADRVLSQGGWALQLTGGGVLDEDATCEELGLMDGQTLYLRPRAEALPEIDFDDLLDGIATAVVRLPGRWRPAWTRALLLGVGATALGAAIACVVLARPGLAPVATGGAIVLGCLGAALGAARALGDRATGLTLALCAVAMAGATGFQAPALAMPAPLAARLLAAGAATAGTALVARIAVGAQPGLFAALACVGALAAAATGARLATGAPAEACAAGAAAVCQLALIVVPPLAFRLGRRRLDPLPTGADDLQEYTDPEPAESVFADVRVIEDYMAGLTVALAVCGCGALTVLAGDPGWVARAFTGVTSALSLLHARALGSVAQRLATVAAGLYGAGLLASAALRSGGAGALVVGALVLTALALGCAAASRIVIARPPAPYWGAAAAIAQWIAAAALFPLTLIVSGTFHLLPRHG